MELVLRVVLYTLRFLVISLVVLVVLSILASSASPYIATTVNSLDGVIEVYFLYSYC